MHERLAFGLDCIPIPVFGSAMFHASDMTCVDIVYMFMTYSSCLDWPNLIRSPGIA